jgi:hypothetical protein
MARVDGINFYYPIKVGDLVTVNAFLTWEKGRRRHKMCKRELMAGDDNYRVCREGKVV